MIIISDIHGHLNTLKALIKKCPADDVVIAGDMIDRGPNSLDVVKYIQDKGWDVISGNHEDFMGNFKDIIPMHWYGVGGKATLKNYKDDNQNLNQELFDAHSLWMRELPLFKHYPEIKNDRGQELLVTHASAGNIWRRRREVSAAKFKNRLLWSRDLNPREIKGIYNVFGHTILKEAYLGKYFAAIDTGCAYKEKGYGVMSALRYPQMEVYTQECLD